MIQSRRLGQIFAASGILMFVARSDSAKDPRFASRQAEFAAWRWIFPWDIEERG